MNVSELHAQKAAKAGATALPDDEIGRLVKEREQAVKSYKLQAASYKLQVTRSG